MLEASLRIPGSVEILVAYTGGLDEVLKSGHMLEAIPMGEYLCDPSWLSSSFEGFTIICIENISSGTRWLQKKELFVHFYDFFI